jgi:hypothetical protein
MAAEIPDGADAAAAVLESLRNGEQPAEGLLVRCLRSPRCPRDLVERIAACRWVRGMQRVPALMLRHPGCPRPFAWEMLPRLGWHEIVGVIRDPRTAAPIRCQGERKLCERLKSLTSGERVALARQATRSVIAEMLADEDPACVQALLSNPQFIEGDAVRLLAANRSGECAVSVVHHPRWGASRAVLNAAIRSPVMPLGVVLGLIASLSRRQLAEFVQSRDLTVAAREAAIRLLEHRRRGDTGAGN